MGRGDIDTAKQDLHEAYDCIPSIFSDDMADEAMQLNVKLRTEAAKRYRSIEQSIENQENLNFSSETTGNSTRSTDSLRLDALREKYARAKAELESRSGLKLVFGRKKIIEEKIAEAQKEYFQAKTEFMGLNVHKLLEEKLKFEDAKYLELTAAKAGAGKIEKGIDSFRRGWKRVGEFNLYNLYKRGTGKDINNWLVKGALKMVNLRTGIALGLMGTTFGWSLAAFKAGLP